MDEINVSIVIPVHNEEENILPLYHELLPVLQRIGGRNEVIFIDDGSTDGTLKKLKEICMRDKTVKTIKLRRRSGQSLALKTGFEFASGKIIVSMDGDMQNNPEDIPKMLETLDRENLDAVCGWRHDRKDPLLKRNFSKISNWLRRKLTEDPIHDSGCTLRAYKKECVKDLELYGELHRYIPSLIFWMGYKIGEVKVDHRPRVHGTSKYDWKRLTKGFLDLIMVTFYQKYFLKPMHVLGTLGLTLGFLGYILLIYLGILRVFYGVGLSDRPLFILAIMLFIAGLQFIILGVLADMIVRANYSSYMKKLVEAVLNFEDIDN
jgi:glycosyltransferase involved in cell wall biosynthesis